MANNDTYILTGTEAVTADWLPPTDAVLAFDAGHSTNKIPLRTGDYVQVRVYSFKTINGVNIRSDTYTESNQLNWLDNTSRAVKLTYTPSVGVDGYFTRLRMKLTLASLNFSYDRRNSWEVDGQYFTQNPAYLVLLWTIGAINQATYNIDKEEIYVDGILIGKGTSL